MRVMPVSFSRLSTFETCPQQFDYLFVSKAVQSVGSEATEYGNRVHEGLEMYGKSRSDDEDAKAEGLEWLLSHPDQTEWAPWVPLVEKLLAAPGTKRFEHQMSIRRDKTPCEWFAEDVWIRSIADVLVVDGKKATILDWKTGKRKENPTQLQLFALMVFLHFPDVNEVRTGFVWLKSGEMDVVTYYRKYAESLWKAVEPRFAALQEAVDLGVFKTKPSGLCPWCPAKGICPDARLKGKR